MPLLTSSVPVRWLPVVHWALVSIKPFDRVRHGNDLGDHDEEQARFGGTADGTLWTYPQKSPSVRVEPLDTSGTAPRVYQRRGGASSIEGTYTSA